MCSRRFCTAPNVRSAERDTASIAVSIVADVERAGRRSVKSIVPTRRARGVTVETEMTSPSLAPTWNVIVCAESSRLDAVELGGRADALDLLSRAGRPRTLIARLVRASRACRSCTARPARGRAGASSGPRSARPQPSGRARCRPGRCAGLVEAADLAAQLLADREAGGVVGGAVDAVAGRQALHRLRDACRSVRDRLRCALNASTLVLMRRDMFISLMSSQGDSMSPVVHRRFDRHARARLEPAAAASAAAATRVRTARSSAITRWRQTATAHAQATT